MTCHARPILVSPVESSADDLAEARESGVSHGLLGGWEDRVAKNGQACFSETILSVSEMLSGRSLAWIWIWIGRYLSWSAH